MSDATSNKDHVRDLIERWADAVCRGDMEGVLASHSPDIVMFDVPEPAQCKGLPAYRQTWQLFFAENGAGPERFRLRELEIHAGDEVAVAYGLLAIAGGSVLCGRCRATGWFVMNTIQCPSRLANIIMLRSRTDSTWLLGRRVHSSHRGDEGDRL
jgi:ketosteroid isomerase-like protein